VQRSRWAVSVAGKNPQSFRRARMSDPRTRPPPPRSPRPHSPHPQHPVSIERHRIRHTNHRQHSATETYLASSTHGWPGSLVARPYHAIKNACIHCHTAMAARRVARAPSKPGHVQDLRSGVLPLGTRKALLRSPVPHAYRCRGENQHCCAKNPPVPPPRDVIDSLAFVIPEHRLFGIVDLESRTRQLHVHLSRTHSLRVPTSRRRFVLSRRIGILVDETEEELGHDRKNEAPSVVAGAIRHRPG